VTVEVSCSDRYLQLPYSIFCNMKREKRIKIKLPHTVREYTEWTSEMEIHKSHILRGKCLKVEAFCALEMFIQMSCPQACANCT